jgi:hypothetical protein
MSQQGYAVIAFAILASPVLVSAVFAGTGAEESTARVAFRLENAYAVYEVGADGRNIRLVDKLTGTDYSPANPESPFAQVKKSGQYYPATAASFDNGRVTVRFGDSGVSAEIALAAQEHYFTLEVLSLAGEGVEELVFADVPLTLQGTSEEEFVCCTLALNLQTNVPNLPDPAGGCGRPAIPGLGLRGRRSR